MSNRYPLHRRQYSFISGLKSALQSVTVLMPSCQSFTQTIVSITQVVSREDLDSDSADNFDDDYCDVDSNLISTESLLC